MTLFSSRCGQRPKGHASIGIVHGVGDREYQQDRYGVSGSSTDQGIFAIVADGMGGLVNSDQVSSSLVETMLDVYAPGGEEDPQRTLRALLQQAVFSIKSLLEASTYQSGSTLISCLIRNSRLSFLSAGDSRVYLWRNGGLIQLNRDHDFAYELNMMILREEITEESAESNPRKGALTSFVGKEYPQKLDYNTEPIQLLRGDRILLCSDGIYRAIDENELSSCLQKGADLAADRINELIEMKKLPHQDNYTAIVIQIK